jgi:hypothetical protein
MSGYEVSRDARVIDDGLAIVQNDDVCYLLDQALGRNWAWVSRRYETHKAPDGWFFLRETPENRVLNKELLAAGLIEYGDQVDLGNRKAQLARVKNG